MNSQKHTIINQFINNPSQFQKPLSNMPQIQNISPFIKPLAFPCRYHPDQICQNYCIEQKCFQALCSQCIQEHLLHHKKSGLNDLYVKSFKSVRSQCSSKLMKIIEKLFSKLGILGQPKNPQQMLEDSDRQLQGIRVHMHQVIDEQFMKIRQAIKQKVSQNFSTVKQLNQIHQNLIKIINQLKEHNTIISQGIVDHPVNVGDSIQKTLMLNQNALLEMFQKQSWKYDQKFRNINVQIMFSQGMVFYYVGEFRQAILASLKIGGSNNNAGSVNSNAGYNKINTNSKASSLGNDIGSRLRSRSKSPINDRTLENSFSKKGTLPNVNYPVLHYFQTGQNYLHLIDLKTEPQKTSVQLGNFRVPTFHASLLSQKTGSIFISGGNVDLTDNPTKSSKMSKFSLISNQFKQNFAEVKPRSSHTLCQDFYADSIYILGGYGESPQQHDNDDSSVTIFETSLQRVNLKNGNVQEMSSSCWGGACIAVMMNSFIVKACMQGVEVFDCVRNLWVQIGNVKGASVEGVFCRGAGYSVMDGSSMLIYGGYDQNQQSRKQCYVMNVGINQQSLENSVVQVQKVNSSLPIAQGFWNNPGIIYNNNLWAVQNVEDEEGQPDQSERTLLRLDLEVRKWAVVKIANNIKGRKN